MIEDLQLEVKEDQQRVLNEFQKLGPNTSELVKEYRAACDHQRQANGRPEVRDLYDALRPTIEELIAEEQQNPSSISELERAYKYHVEAIKHLKQNLQQKSIEELDSVISLVQCHPYYYVGTLVWIQSDWAPILQQLSQQDISDNTLLFLNNALKEEKARRLSLGYKSFDDSFVEAMNASSNLRNILLSGLTDSNLTLALSSKTLDEVLENINDEFKETLSARLLKCKGEDLANLCRDIKIYKLMNMKDISREFKENCLNAIIEFFTEDELDKLVSKMDPGFPYGAQFRFSGFMLIIPQIREQIKEFILEHSNFGNDQNHDHNPPNIQNLASAIIDTVIAQVSSMEAHDFIKFLSLGGRDLSPSMTITHFMKVIFEFSKYSPSADSTPQDIRFAEAIRARIQQLGPEALIAHIKNMMLEHNLREDPIHCRNLEKVEKQLILSYSAYANEAKSEGPEGTGDYPQATVAGHTRLLGNRSHAAPSVPTLETGYDSDINGEPSQSLRSASSVSSLFTPR